jgi:protocatechuate 3,4-dioxygenase beta subunit
MNDDHDGNVLIRDLRLMAERRQFLRWLGALSLVPLVGCAKDDLLSSDGGTASGGSAGTGAASTKGSAGSTGAAGSGATTRGTTSSTTTSSGTCTSIPEETGGPYPGDGSNGPNALSLSDVVRSDIRSSIAPASGKAAGVPLTIELTLVDAKGNCAALSGFAIYLWHCDRDGNYSMYSAAAASENYLRGVQETDAQGTATFLSIFPACYSGRWPHIHFEVYESLAGATSGGNKLATSQLALPEVACNAVFATDGYSASVRNLTQVSLASDNVFSDGATLETPEISGSPSQGYTVSLKVAINT